MHDRGSHGCSVSTGGVVGAKAPDWGSVVVVVVDVGPGDVVDEGVVAVGTGGVTAKLEPVVTVTSAGVDPEATVCAGS